MSSRSPITTPTQSKGTGRNSFQLEIDPKILEIPSNGHLTVHIKNVWMPIAGIVVELTSAMFRIENSYDGNDFGGNYLMTRAYTTLNRDATIDLVIRPRESLLGGWGRSNDPEGTLSIYHYYYPPIDEKSVYDCKSGSNAWQSPYEFPFLWTKRYDRNYGEIEMDLVLPVAEGHVKKMRKKYLKEKKREEKRLRKSRGKGCTIV